MLKREIKKYDGVYQGPLDNEEYILWLQDIHTKYLLPSFDKKSLIRDFPGAKKFIIEKLEKELAEAQAQIKEADRLEPVYHEIIYTQSDPKNEWFWKAIVEILFLNPLREKQQKIIKENSYLLSQLRGKSKTNNIIGVTENEIQQAREFPVTDLISFKNNKAICPFHNEKTPSLNYYKKNNTCYCFGACQKSFDSIEVYKKLNNCSFVEAVRKLQ